jgi:hypothetical protein
VVQKVQPSVLRSQKIVGIYYNKRPLVKFSFEVIRVCLCRVIFGGINVL